jgi:putative addiction module component (TIGR02574 family)
MHSEDPMNQAVEHFKLQLSGLSGAERAELAYYLLTSLEPEDAPADAEWRDEIARRVAAIQGGTATGRPAEAVLADLRKQYP